jgi:hypothetical protein
MAAAHDPGDHRGHHIWNRRIVPDVLAGAVCCLPSAAIYLDLVESFAGEVPDDCTQVTAR